MFSKDTSILIVDDMAGAREFIRTQLAALGYLNIIESEDGNSAFLALESACELGMPVGLIISDWTMPGLSGQDLLMRVRNNPALSATPFLMITAKGEADAVVKAVQSGVSDYVVKPFTSEIFYKKISAIWKKHSGNR